MTDSKFNSAVLGLVVLTFVLRLWGIWWYPAYRGTESMHVPAASNYVHNGQFVPDPWYAPPQKHIFLTLSMKVFGDNPFGWRLRNILMSTLSCLLLTLLAKEIFKDRAIALLSGVFYALDPLEVAIARSTYEDPGSVTFFLLFFYLSLRYIRRDDRILPAVGLALGCSIAGRWYYAPAASVIILYMLHVRFWREDRSLRRAAYIVSSTAFLGAAAYFAFYIPWFSRGYGLGDFMPMQFDALRELANTDRSSFSAVLGESGKPIKWFLWPEVVLFMDSPGEAGSRMLMFSNNPPVWLLTLPAAGLLARAAMRKRNELYALLLVCLAVTYAQYISLSRPIFFYTGLSTLPFTSMLVAYAVITYMGATRKWYLGVVGLWSVYVYPLAIGASMPVVLYAPLMAVAHYVRSVPH